jgi:MFS family permease
MSTDARSGGAGPRAKVSTALVVMSIFISTAARQVLNPLQELVKHDLGLSDNQVALLQGLALALPLILFSFPLGRLVDRWNRSRLLFVFAIGCAVGSILTAFAQSYAAIFATRMLVGLSFAGVFMTSLSLISDLSSAGSRGRSIMLLYLGQVFGASACFVLVGALVGWLPTVIPVSWGLTALAPWRLVQIVFAAAILAGALTILLLREPDRREVGTALKGDTRAALKELWSYRGVLLPLLVGMATINMADAAAEIWAVPVLTRTFHQQPADFGTWMGLVALCAGIGGALAGGFLSDFGQRIAGRGGILIGAILGAAISIPAAFYPLMPNVEAFAVLLAIFLIAGSCNGTAGTAAVALLMPNELRGITTAIFGTISMLVAYGLAPLLVSATAGGLGFGAAIGVPLAAIGCVTSVIGTIAFIVAMRDARRREPDIAISNLAPNVQHSPLT